ncbi:MAG: amidohydrolase family protein [Acidimicrobiales bacterium]
MMLRNARLTDGRLVDLALNEGLIATVAEADGSAPTAGDVDLGGWLLLPSMTEPHAHLDKALTAEMVPNPKGDLMGAIDAWIEAAAMGKITHEGIVERAIAAMDLLLVHGVTAVRTHVNVLGSIGAAAVVAVREAAAQFEGVLDVQIVALCGSPLTGPEGASTRAALAEALEVGVDFVGGCPHIDPDGPGLIRLTMEAATEAGIGMDLHVDEMLDPGVLTLRDYARQVIDTGFEGLVAASHCVTLGMQSPEVQAEVASEVAEAGIAVFPLPQTNLFLQGRDDPTATPRGLTAVQALQDAGVLVAAGADNVQDPFNLVGRSDPLETAALMVMAGHQLPDTAYDMVANNARQAIGLPAVEIRPGDPADLVAIDSVSIREAIADAPMSRRVFRRGVLVASSDQQVSVNR